MKRITRRVASMILAIYLSLGYLPIIVPADGAEPEPDTALKSEEAANTWEEIEEQSEVILKDPNLFTEPEGAVMDGAEVHHDRNSRTYLLEDETYVTRLSSEPLTYTDDKGKER
ncbi:MAG: hypothetical protein LBQ21_03460, partial [Clostridiales Family XIII bacterium]|nr:hypothetical protein [Clostridiales Family XIII bacterium]